MKSALAGKTELSFVTSYEQTVLHIAISSSLAKNSNRCMPSAVSSDCSIRVCSSIHMHQLADSVADCVSKQTSAYTMLQAVWHSMEECCEKIPVDATAGT